MPITNGIWTNYTFSNCALRIVDGSVQYTNVSFNQLNASGLLCSVATNFPWFFTIFIMVIFIVCMFLFSYLNDLARTLLISAAFTFVLATILIGYGVIAPITWMATLMLLALALGYQLFH